MATALPTGYPTLLNWSKTRAPNGGPAVIANLLEQTNEILPDAYWQEANDTMSELVTQVTSLPGGDEKAFNEGVVPTTGDTAQIPESICMFERRAVVDCDIADLKNSKDMFRLHQLQMHIEALGQKFAHRVFQGNPATSPKQIRGLGVRYNSLSGNVAQNVISCGGSGSDNMSVYLVVHGPQGVYFTFPKGSEAGLSIRDLGEQTLNDAMGTAGARLQVYEHLLKWKWGIAVADWRCVVRICNIDVSDAVGQSGTQEVTDATAMLKAMLKAQTLIPKGRLGRACYYMNPTAFAALQMYALDKAANVLSIKEGASQFGTPRAWGTCLGIPFKQVDQLPINEAAVS